VPSFSILFFLSMQIFRKPSNTNLLSTSIPSSSSSRTRSFYLFLYRPRVTTVVFTEDSFDRLSNFSVSMSLDDPSLHLSELAFCTLSSVPLKEQPFDSVTRQQQLQGQPPLAVRCLTQTTPSGTTFPRQKNFCFSAF
jgi:hypothetical protein